MDCSRRRPRMMMPYRDRFRAIEMIMSTTIATVATAVALTLFVFAMVYAAISDIITYRIANTLVLVLLVAYAGLAPIVGLTLQEIVRSIVAASAVLFFSFALFTQGLLGGGDAKLATVTTLWLGAENTITYLLALTLLGGVLAGFFYLCHTLPLPQRVAKTAWITRLRANNAVKLPYGVAITLAGLCVL